MLPRRFLLLSLVLFVIGGAVFYQYKKYRVAPEIIVQDLQLSNISGQLISITSATTDYVLVCFFGTWCGSCISEVPSLETLVANQTNISVWLVSDEQPERLSKFQQAHLTLQILQLARPLSEINIHTVPTAYLLNKSGDVLLKKVGENDWSADAELLSYIGVAR